MLIFQRDIEHIKEACQIRWEQPFSSLVQLVHEINRYLPHDWRMTGQGNFFRVQVIANPMPTIALPGNSFRGEHGKIFHVINTVLGAYMADNQSKRSGREEGESHKQHKEKNPQIVIPNAYFFRPHLHGFSSPLFVRQFEKINKRDKTCQYHRIHPLTKEGVDHEHYLWVCWNVDQGSMKIEEPPVSFHGKNFWVVPSFSKAFPRLRGAQQIHKDLYRKILKENKILELDTPVQERVYTPEYKFLIPKISADSDDTIYRIIENAINEIIKSESGNTSRDSDAIVSVGQGDTTIHTDTYLDDHQYSIYRAGASLRIRKTDDTSLFLTLKKQEPFPSSGDRKRLYKRFSEEVMLTQEEKQRLLKNQPVWLIPLTVLDYMVPERGKLRESFTVTTRRHRKVFEILHNAQIELRLDKTVFTIDGNESTPFYEVEIENIYGTEQVAALFCEKLQRHISLLPSRLSKYERGIFLVKSKAANTAADNTARQVIIDTDCGVDDALALMLALRSPAMRVEAVTTVSGNVHVDKVVPNVFKVFDALDLELPPPVAKGADKPLRKELDTAASVHGEDGLGDAVSAPVKTECLDKPAWQVICEQAKQSPGKITLITLGPLTNLALAIQNEPNSVRCLKEVVCMGGVFFDVGNVGPDAEFNIHADPDAAAEVVAFCKESMQEQVAARRLPLTFIGLDVTHQVQLNREELQRAADANPGNNVLDFARNISQKYMDFYKDNEGLSGCYLHDPLAVAYVLNRAFLDTEQHIIRVETRGQFTSGVIFPDDRPTRNTEWRNPDEAVINIARHVNKGAFEEFFLLRLAENPV